MNSARDLSRPIVWFVSPEAVPFASTGGLGEVAGSLPRALAGLGAEVHLVMPLYGQVDRAAHGVKPSGPALSVPMPSGEVVAQVHQARLGPCPVHFIAQERYFGRPGLYGTPQGDFPDNAERFVFFCRAALALPAALGLAVDVVHCHDWQTALAPVYVAAGLAGPDPASRPATVLTIHNLAYQGIFPSEQFWLTGLPDSYNHPRGLEYWGNLSFLKAGLLAADALTTVSPGYSAEILQPEHGRGLEGVLQSRAPWLHGILNGADYDRWSPASDALLPARFSPDDLGGKLVCRDALLREFGLDPADEQTTVMGYVGRLAEQKGVDLILEALPKMLMDQVRLVILGQGDAAIESAVSRAAKEHPGQVGVKLAYDDRLAHLVQAGSDLLLMPSRFEPCGLNQMHAMRYGTIVAAHATGGLKDTIEPFDPKTGQGTGFLFRYPQADQLLHAVREALWTKARTALWGRLMANAMAADFSWDRSAAAYLKLYQDLMAGGEG